MTVTVAELREALGSLAEGRSDLELLQWLAMLEWVAGMAVEAAIDGAKRRLAAPLVEGTNRG